MERCLEEIASTVLDAGEPISYRTLSIRSQIPVSQSVKALTSFFNDNKSVKTLQLLIKRVAVDNDGHDCETTIAKRDPRARVLSLASGSQKKTDDLICQQIYALYNALDSAVDDTVQVAVMATACWAQERQARNLVLSSGVKNEPLSAAAKALYASSITCTEATARQRVGDQGEETISAFEAINASVAQKTYSSSSFFKNSGKTGSIKTSNSIKNGGTTAKTETQAKKLDMTNVLTVNSDDEDDDETDAPVFVKKSATNKRIISDDEDEEDCALTPIQTSTPVPKSRKVKRKLNASPAETAIVKQSEESEEESRAIEHSEPEDEDEKCVEKPIVATKRRVLVSKTRINEQGYMVTEKMYQELELTREEVEKEEKAAKKKVEEKKKGAAAEKAVKAKKDTNKQSGLPKQCDLRSFFSTK